MHIERIRMVSGREEQLRFKYVSGRLVKYESVFQDKSAIFGTLAATIFATILPKKPLDAWV